MALSRVALHDSQALDMYLRRLLIGRQQRQMPACTFGGRSKCFFGLFDFLVLKQLKHANGEVKGLYRDATRRQALE